MTLFAIFDGWKRANTRKMEVNIRLVFALSTSIQSQINDCHMHVIDCGSEAAVHLTSIITRTARSWFSNYRFSYSGSTVWIFHEGHVYTSEHSNPFTIIWLTTSNNDFIQHSFSFHAHENANICKLAAYDVDGWP